LGIAYDQAGNTAEALAIFRQFPTDATVTARAAQLMLDTNNAAGAIPQLEAQAKAAPTTANRLLLIEAYKQTGQAAKVFEQLKLAAEADPTNYEVHMSYGRALRDQRHFLEAARQFSAAVTLRPDSVPALNDLAGDLIIAEKYEEGLAVLDKLRALGKEIPGDIYLRAITLDRLRRKSLAVEAYKQFLAVAGGKFPDEEFLSRQRVRIIETEMNR